MKYKKNTMKNTEKHILLPEQFAHRLEKVGRGDQRGGFTGEQDPQNIAKCWFRMVANHFGDGDSSAPSNEFNDFLNKNEDFRFFIQRLERYLGPSPARIDLVDSF